MIGITDYPRSYGFGSVPCFNLSVAVERTVDELRAALSAEDCKYPAPSGRRCARR